MILAHKNSTYAIPLKSKCTIISKGVLKDNDMVDIISPIFVSNAFNSYKYNLSDSLSVKLRLVNSNSVTSDGSLIGYLICHDNDIFDLCVECYD